MITDRGRPQIGAKAILALHAIVPGEHEGFFVVCPSASRALRRDISVLTAAADALPRFGLNRRHETIGPGRVFGVRNALEGIDAVANKAGHTARANSHDHLTVTSDQRRRVSLPRIVGAR